ncbi:MAG TPA: hypothetical protein V6D46_06770 [Coleofasciculaceae cyanobacterium]
MNRDRVRFNLTAGQAWLDRQLDRLGNWNPQLLRELKGSLVPRNVISVIVLTIAAQILFLSQRYNAAISVADLAHSGVDWHAWWLKIFFDLSISLTIVPVLSGVYALVNDWTQETKQGTLDFIRMTPESSNRIILGKLLGVPAIAHGYCLLVLPLQMLAGLQAGLGLGGLLLTHGSILAIVALFYTLALLYATVTARNSHASSALACAVLALIALVPMITVAQAVIMRSTSPDRPWSSLWFGQELISPPIGLALLTIVSCGGVAATLWQAVDRRFTNPANTLLTKSRSYLLTIGFNLLTLGFFSPARASDVQSWVCVGVPWFGLMLLWMGWLMPQRKRLLDWARYRHLTQTQRSRSWRSSWRDWLWNDHSPPFLALAVNGGLTIALWLPWALSLWVADGTAAARRGAFILLSIGCSTTLILLCAALAQWVLLLKARRPAEWATGAVAIVLMGSLGMATFVESHFSMLALLTPLGAWAAVGGTSAGLIPFGSAGVALAIGSVAAAGVGYFAMTRLEHLGASESAALMRGDRLDS